MRVALVAQWLRVARDHPPARGQALRYAGGIAAVQVGWVARLALPVEWTLVSFVVLGVCELLVPVWAERADNPGLAHPGHIAERYGLFTLIVLGESVAAATVAVQQAAATGLSTALTGVAAGGLLLTVGLWWLYFDKPAGDALWSLRTSFAWGYGHVVIFASLAAIGAGLQVAAEAAHDPAGNRVAAWAVAVPVAAFLVVLGAIQQLTRQRRGPVRLAALVATVVLVLGSAAVSAALPASVAVLLMGLFVAALVVVDVTAA
jgi:low temperature requirement protein LtrA